MSRPVYAYGIVVLPPPDLRRQVMALRRQHPVLHASGPPHITVKSPFLFRGTGAWVAEILEEVCARHQPFELELAGLASFGTSVIYIPVVPCQPLLDLHHDLVESLAGYVETLNEKYEGAGYTPHLTVADHLTPEDYQLARQLLQGWYPRGRVWVDRIHLLRGRGRWDITRSFPLGDP
ncbi:MAG: 2'-5' RNA ligase family protein [Bacillota bacterium]|nr:MAG: hypothetical protein DIU70_04930 [Bacillota bacterium]